jgi:hypothetical protein
MNVIVLWLMDLDENLTNEFDLTLEFWCVYQG